MIIDLQKFIAEEQPRWQELETVLDRLENGKFDRMSLAEVRRFHYLYERVAADLGQISTFAFETETRRYLEALVARAYGEIHEIRARPHRFQPVFWLMHTLPCTFRRYRRAFALSCAITLAGCLLGGGFILTVPDAREIILPWQLWESPQDRVLREEKQNADHLQDKKASGASWYIEHNTKVAIFTMALGATWGVGTVLLLAFNGVLLGAICVDYLLAGQTKFLFGWLLPHGAVEIPAILLAGQAGLVLAGALIGWGRRRPLRDRLRQVGPDLVTLMAGIALLLIWAGLVEAFLSQYHEPVLPYALKIMLGVLELILLTMFLWRAGRGSPAAGTPAASPGSGEERP